MSLWMRWGSVSAQELEAPWFSNAWLSLLPGTATEPRAWGGGGWGSAMHTCSAGGPSSWGPAPSLVSGPQARLSAPQLGFSASAQRPQHTGPSPLELLLFLCLQSTVPSLSPSSAAPGQGQQLDRTRPPPVVTAEARPLLPGAVRGPVTNHTVSPFLRLGSEPAEAEAARLCQAFMREQEESHPGSQRD